MGRKDPMGRGCASRRVIRCGPSMPTSRWSSPSPTYESRAGLCASYTRNVGNSIVECIAMVVFESEVLM
jgi:hypothetical protein